MTWFARQMMSYSKNGTDITYKYDNDGLRAEKTVGNVKHEYYYVDGLLKIEKIGDDYEMYYRYDTDGVLASVTRYTVSTDASSILYAQTNTRGDVISLYDGDGATRVKYVYDSWGKLISATDGNGNALAETAIGSLNSIRYRGYVYDTETGLYYLQSRYYDPETDRFLNADDVDFIGYSGEVLSYNMFAYCENGPVCSKDSMGFFKNMFSILKVISKDLQKTFFLEITMDRLNNIASQKSTLQKIKLCKYVKISFSKNSYGLYCCSLVFGISEKFNIGTNYYVDMNYGSRNAWNKYADNILASRFKSIWTNTYAIIGKSVLVAAVSFINVSAAIVAAAVGIVNIISEININKDMNFAENSKIVLDNNKSETFIAISGIHSISTILTTPSILYKGDDRIWPVQ